ncbi:MAG: hypothetical protein GTO41_27560, partial [Burkholderiales bacterium]|nr:hypothetical protein [Burkholderiales bacterium]
MPDLFTGGIRSGYSIGADPADFLSAEMVFSQHVQGVGGGGPPLKPAVTESVAVKFNSAQEIEWAAGTGFLATMTHANTAARTYTFQDKDCTVACLSDLDTLLPKWVYKTVTTPSGTGSAGDFIRADASGGDVTITIDETSATNDGCEIAIQRVDSTPANKVTVTRSGADTFLGTNVSPPSNTSFELKKEGEAVTLASDNGSGVW